MKAAFHTLGCKVNQYETQAMTEQFERAGFEIVGEDEAADCYIINTGDFYGKDVTKDITLGVLEAIVEKRADFKQWGPFEDIEIFEWEGFVGE